MSEIVERAARALEGVLFDYGETLVEFVRPEAALAAADARIVALLAASGHSGLTADLLRTPVLDRVDREVSEHQRRGELREISVMDASRVAFADAGVHLDDALLDEVLRIEQEAWWHGARLDPTALPLLDGLRQDGLRVGLCSNAPYRVRSLHEQLSFVGLDAHLDTVTFSAEVGWRKPSPLLFAAALAAIGTDAAGTVMVGDSEASDIAGAHAAGMRAVLLRRSGADAPTAADAVVSTLSDVPVALRDIGLYWG
ncbi:MAG TPA: HAD family hydrolase [Candidatus Dormibacteraeota bacterium]